MLTAGSQALTANELAFEAGVTPSTASGHLGRLLDFGLLSVAKQGLHRYYGLAGPEVAGAVEQVRARLGGRHGSSPPGIFGLTTAVKNR